VGKCELFHTARKFFLDRRCPGRSRSRPSYYASDAKFDCSRADRQGAGRFKLASFLPFTATIELPDWHDKSDLDPLRAKRDKWVRIDVHTIRPGGRLLPKEFDFQIPSR
jgi:hypothetical protein